MNLDFTEQVVGGGEHRPQFEASVVCRCLVENVGQAPGARLDMHLMAALVWLRRMDALELIRHGPALLARQRPLRR